jgi:hypothetical protein
VFLYEGLRHLLGYHVGGGHDVYAIWDRETGDARSFPLTDEGWRQAWTEFSNLEATATPGVRMSPWRARRPRAGVIAVLGAMGTIAVLALVRVVLPGIGPDGAGGVVIFREDFTDPSTGFPRGEDSGTRSGPVDGTYQLLFKRAATTFQGGTTPAIAAMRVEADITVVDAPGPTQAGLACVAGGGGPFTIGYFFLISPRDGEYSIGDGESVIAADRRPGAVRTGPGATNHVVRHCTGSVAGRPARMVMFVNGRKVLETNDPSGFTRFNGFLVVGTAREGGTDIRFDNLAVRRY